MKLILFILMSISVIYADISKKPFSFPLENNEPYFSIQYLQSSNKSYYILEKLYAISAEEYNNGVTYFLPSFLKESNIGIMSYIIGTSVDSFLSKVSSHVDIANPKPLSQCFKEARENGFNVDKIILDSVGKGKTIAFPPEPSIQLVQRKFDIIDSLKNSKIIFYPITKRDYIQKKGSIYQVSKPISISLSYKLDKSLVDNFINKSAMLVSKYTNHCTDPMTYLNRTTLSHQIEKIKSYLPNNKKYIVDIDPSQFHNLKELNNTITTIDTFLDKNTSVYPQVKRYIDTLRYLVEITAKKPHELKNFCLYMNYILDTPAYKNFSNITIINSNPHHGTLDDLYSFFKKINGYVIDGRIVSLNNQKYFLDKSKNVFDITKSCHIDTNNKIEERQLKSEILRLAENEFRRHYLIFMDDWDNDADDREDCLRYTPSSNTLEKAKIDKNGSLQFTKLDLSKIGSIEYSNDIVYFDKRSYPAPQSSSQSSASSVSGTEGASSTIDVHSSSQFSSLSSSYHQSESSSIGQSNSSISSSLDVPFPTDTSFNAEENEIPISTSSSSSQNSSSSYPSVIQAIIDKVLHTNGGIYPVDGYFFKYDFNKDGSTAPSDWIYMSANSGSTYQLLGDTSQENMQRMGIFGWKKVNIQPPQKDYYMVHYDQSDKFGWLIFKVQNSHCQDVYKLAGQDPRTKVFSYDVDGDGHIDHLPLTCELLEGNRVEFKPL